MTFNLISILYLIISALIGALIGHFFIVCRERSKKKKDLKVKEKLIQDDLKKKDEILYQLKQSYYVLDINIKTSTTFDFPIDVFHDLHTDVYSSVTNSDIHQIFKEDFFLLVNVYKAIDHLKEFSLASIKSRYTKSLSHYIKKNEKNIGNIDKEDFNKHVIQCRTQAGNQIQANVRTIDGLFKEIAFLLENIKNPKLRANNPKRKEIESREVII